MAGDLASQMMRKKERQLKKMCVRYMAGMFFVGLIAGGVIVALIFGPVQRQRDALRLGLEASEGLRENLDQELRLWRRGGSVADCVQNRWLLHGCREENERLQDDLVRYQDMTGWIYEDDPDQRVLLYGWEGLDGNL